MKALKYQVQIGRDHKVVVDVPDGTPEGPAEVIVLVPEQEVGASGLDSLLAAFRARPGERSKEEIDAQLAEERAGWSRE